MTFFILKNDIVMYYRVKYEIYMSLFFSPVSLGYEIWNLRKMTWIGLLQASYSVPQGTLYFSAFGESGGKVAKT